VVVRTLSVDLIVIVRSVVIFAKSVIVLVLLLLMEFPLSLMHSLLLTLSLRLLQMMWTRASRWRNRHSKKKD